MLALALTFVVGFAGVLWKWREAERARESEHAARLRESAALELARNNALEVRTGLERLKAASGLLDRGREYVDRFQWDDAHAAFTKAIELRPDVPAAWVERAKLYIRLGLWDNAATDYQQEMKLRDADTAFRWYQHAMLRLYVGDIDGYREACEKTHRLFHGTLQARFAEEELRTQVLIPNPQLDLGPILRTLRQVANTRPLSGRFILGAAHYRDGQDDEAIQQLKAAMSETNGLPVNSLSHAVLAMAHHRQGRTAEARQALEEMGRILDEWTRARFASPGADWVVHQGANGSWTVPWRDYLEGQLRYREAKLLVDGVVPEDDPRLHVLRARALAGLRRWDAAAEEYAVALRLNPDDRMVQQEAHRTRGYCCAHCREWNNAAREFARACELQPNDSYLWRFLAISYFAAEDWDAYRRTCSDMLERFRATSDAVTAGNVLLVCELRADSLADMSKLLPLTQVAKPIWHWGSYTRGAALYRAGRSAEAIRWFESASETFPPRAWDWCFSSMAHSSLGNVTDARRCLNKANEWIHQANENVADDLSDTRPRWGDWHESVVAQLLYREAEFDLRRTSVIGHGQMVQDLRIQVYLDGLDVDIDKNQPADTGVPPAERIAPAGGRAAGRATAGGLVQSTGRVPANQKNGNTSAN